MNVGKIFLSNNLSEKSLAKYLLWLEELPADIKDFQEEYKDLKVPE